MILYQFHLSHYCEKVRWALDYKKLPYQIKELLPLLHVFKIKPLTGQTSVPVLKDGNQVIADSTKIIDYLDSKFPNVSLTPTDPELAKQALAWEELADEEIGPHLRRYAYAYLLPHSNLVLPLLLQKRGKLAQAIYPFFFPLVRFLMRKGMNITQDSAERSLKKLTAAMEKLELHLSAHSYLVGNCFTRADLTVASLMAPFCQPPEHPLKGIETERLPQTLRKFVETHQNSRLFHWVLEIYRNHRKPLKAT